MKNISDKSIDCVICDLPYGTTSCSWDVIIPLDELWVQYNRIVKDNGAIILFGQEASRCISQISDEILANMKAVQSEEASEMLVA